MASNMVAILQSIIQILVAGVSELGQGIASGLAATVTALFIDSTGTTPALSTLGGVIALFGGIALAVGITRLAVGWVMSLGARK